MREPGIDITLNNPDHVLSPGDYEMVLDARFGRISEKEYQRWYMGVIRNRLKTRGREIRELALEGADEEIVLKCYCPSSSPYCHGKLASSFMNAVVKKICSPRDKRGG